VRGIPAGVDDGPFGIAIVTTGTVAAGGSGVTIWMLEVDMRHDRRIRMRRPHERVLAVEEGQVVCPRRGVIDIETCFACPRFRGFQEGITEDLVCGYESVLGIADFSWAMDTTAR
jgi:hypothetical protein